MKKESPMSFDIALSILGVIILVVLRNSTRFLGIGLISLGITYYLCDRYTLGNGSHLRKRYGK